MGKSKSKSVFSSVLFFVFVAVVVVSALGVVVAQTVPSPPDVLTVGSVGNHVETTSGVNVPAQAGNVSALTISDVRKTQFWQGYYGNVTGQIVLDDANNATLFAWELANPAGEIYAVNTTSVVQWSNVSCVNFTALNATSSGPGSGKINLSSLAVQFNMNNSLSLENLSKDAFNYTFNTTYSGSFQTGTVAITASNNCPQVTTFVDDVYQTGAFKQVLMYDNLSALIFVALLENNKNGYQAGGNDLSDFQMVVAADGTPGKSGLSTYYFYVELS